MQTAKEVKPFIVAAYFTIGKSSHPSLLARPVLAPNSSSTFSPVPLKPSVSAPKSSVGNGQSPTADVKAFITPTISSILLIGNPPLTAAYAATGFDDVT